MRKTQIPELYNIDDALDDRIYRIESFFLELRDPDLRDRIIREIQEVRKLDSGIKKLQFVSSLEKYIEGLDI